MKTYKNYEEIDISEISVQKYFRFKIFNKICEVNVYERQWKDRVIDKSNLIFDKDAKNVNLAIRQRSTEKDPYLFVNILPVILVPYKFMDDMIEIEAYWKTLTREMDIDNKRFLQYKAFSSLFEEMFVEIGEKDNLIALQQEVYVTNPLC